MAFVSTVESLLTSWWQVILVIAVSFVGLTLCRSMYRFRLMLEALNHSEDVSPEDGLDYFQALIAQNISAIRSHSEFGVGVIRSSAIGPDDLHEFIKQRRRAEVDGVIRVKDWVGVVVASESEGLDRAFARWSEELKLPLQAGAAFYPDFARTSGALIAAAEESMLQVAAEEGGLIWSVSEVDEEVAEQESGGSEADDIVSDSSLDPLTGVLGMHKVASYMRKYVAEYRFNHQLALFFIGINGMSDIEELHCKEAGDEVRKAVSDLMQNALREDDVIGRYAEDEFLVLLVCDEEHVAGIAKRLRDRSQKLVVHYNNRRIKVTVNIGVSMCPRHGRGLPAMFAAAKGAYDVAQRRQGSMCLIAGEE
ncbi:GGDEF domain-containing protein [Verrucomicrobiota bacterium]